MTEATQKARHQRKQAARKVLRAFNGAALGLVLGGLIGALLGAMFARIVLSPRSFESAAWAIGAFYGVFPGAFAGTFIGMTAVVRDHRAGMLAGTMMGFLVGCFYAMLTYSPYLGLGVAACIVASGIIGGYTLSRLIRTIRTRWRWWTRWEQ